MNCLKITLLALALVVGTAACGDDTDTDAGTGTDSGTGMDTSGMDTGGSDTGTGTDTTTGTDTAGTDTMTGTDTAGTDTGGEDAGESAAATFCNGYETTCTFGEDRYADSDACIAAFDGGSEACQTCITTHLGLAAGDADTHCPHATGMGPCAENCGE